MSSTCGSWLAGDRASPTAKNHQAIALSRQMAKAQLFQRLQRIKLLFFLAKIPETQ
ncbi:MAG: hypothetical protein ACN6N6_05800 [Pseudomonas putida]